ncbi:MAG: Fur family transcriptional regulator, partial [Nocardioides sp.]
MTSTDGPGPAAVPGGRPTRQRRAVAEVLGTISDFRSAQEIHELLAQRGEAVGLATVYRTLQRLAEAGEVDVLRTEDGEAIY